MEKLKKEKLESIANKTMDFNKVGQCFVTCDGTPFLRKNAAGLHAFANNMEVHPFGEAEEVKEPKAKLEDQGMRIGGTPGAAKEETKESASGDKAPKAAELISQIEKAKSESEVSEILGTDARKNVKKAAAKRMEELKSISMRGDQGKAEETRLAEEKKSQEAEKKDVADKIAALNGAEDVETLDALFGIDEREEVRNAYNSKVIELNAAQNEEAKAQEGEQPLDDAKPYTGELKEESKNPTKS
jgi:hypothetical protein